MKFSRILPVLVVLAVVAGGVVFFANGKGKKSDDGEGEPVVEAQLRDIESTLLLTGSVEASLTIDVKPEVGGRIKELRVAVGDRVPKGEVLATIDDRDLQTERASALTEIDGAQLAVGKAKGNYERAKALYEQKLISKEVYANLEADYEIAQNTLEKAQRRLQTVEDKLVKTRILAPFDGTVLDIPQTINVGQVVTAAASVNSGTVIMTFANLDDLMIRSQVNQMDAPQLKEGQALEISTEEGEARGAKAHIAMVPPLAKVKNNVKGFEVRIVIDENNGQLKPGMSVSMYVPIGKAENAVSIPVTAIFRDRDKSVVYVRNGEKTERRVVKVGITDTSYAEIKSGLKEGEQVLLVEPANPHRRS